MKLLIKLSSPASRHFLPLRTKSSPEYTLPLTEPKALVLCSEGHTI